MIQTSDRSLKHGCSGAANVVSPASLIEIDTQGKVRVPRIECACQCSQGLPCPNSEKATALKEAR